MSDNFEIKMDTREFDRQIKELMTKVKRPAKLMTMLRRYTNAMTMRMFRSRPRADTSVVRGVKWAKLKKSTKKQKKALKKDGKSLQIFRPLVRTGSLRDSLKILEKKSKGFKYGTRIKNKKGFHYPGVHQNGRGKVPKREFLFYTEKDFKQMVRITVDYLEDDLKGIKHYTRRG